MLRQIVTTLSAFAIISTTLFVGCVSSDPSVTGTDSTSPIVIGSQDYYSSEIIAEIYAQALENSGYTVERNFRIGQREVYLPDIEQGNVDLFPEYTGPLLQYFAPDASARLADAVYAELEKAIPSGLRLLDQSPATDQDAYVVTKEFADKWGLVTIEDLTKVTDPLTMGANSEAESRPNGPTGLKQTYGVEVGFTPIEDGGGPLTVKALKDDLIQLAIIYTADPSVATNNLVPLTDTKGLFLASNVVPLASDNVDEQAAEIINKISAAMTPQELVALNQRSVAEQLSATTIASDWLTKVAS